jgi:phenylalanyl-tRNA synthetase beta chain
VCDLLLGSASSEAVYTLSSDARLHPGRQALVALRGKRVGVVGELHPELAVRLRVRERVAMFEMDGGALLEAVAGPCPFVAPSPYPAVVRDLAPRIATSVPYADIRAAVLQAGGPLLGEVALVDVYSGDRLPEGVRSLTLSLTLRSLDRTLTDAESEVTLDLIRERLRSEFGATFVGD